MKCACDATVQFKPSIVRPETAAYRDDFTDASYGSSFNCQSPAVRFYVSYNTKHIESRCTNHSMLPLSIERLQYDEEFSTYEAATAALAMRCL